jgi:hypothetical protein
VTAAVRGATAETGVHPPLSQEQYDVPCLRARARVRNARLLFQPMICNAPCPTGLILCVNVRVGNAHTRAHGGTPCATHRLELPCRSRSAEKEDRAADVPQRPAGRIPDDDFRRGTATAGRFEQRSAPIARQSMANKRLLQGWPDSTQSFLNKLNAGAAHAQPNS